MRYNKFVTLLLAVSLCGNSFSQNLDTEKLDKYLQAMDAGNRFMGNVVVYRDNKKIYSHSSGFSNIEAGTKPDDQTMYRIGSISKTITATLVMKAIEEGRIKLSDNIKAFFPSIKYADQITISSLLNHHSGVHNFTGGNFFEWNTQPKSRIDLIDSIAKGGSDFAPGTKASYSNSNYVLLSFMLEDIYHKPYAEILNDKIVHPLHLTHFQFGDKQINKRNKALPYYFEAGWNVSKETNLSIPMGAGAIVSTAGDLAKVLEALFHGKIVSTEMLRKMEEQSDGFGYGIFEKNILGKTAYSHDGAIDGFNSYYYFFPQDETLLILLSNAENYDLEIMNKAMLSIVFNSPVDLPTPNTYKVTAKELQQYIGSYTSDGSPLIIEISSKNNYLLAQPHGQRVYTMEPTEKNKFLHEKTGVTLEFDPEQHQMVMKQGQKAIVFIKK